MDLWAEYGNGFTAIIFLAGLIAANAGAVGAAPAVVIVLVAFGVFPAFMNILTFKLALLENGCKADRDGFFQSMEWIALVIAVAKAAVVAAGAFLSFISTNGVIAAPEACRR